MSDYRLMDETPNAGVLGVAGVASGIVGGVLATIMARNAKREEEKAATPANMAALIDSVRGSANDSLSGVLSQAPQSRKEWTEAAQELRKQAAASAREGQKRSRKRLNEVDLEAVSKRARSSVATAGMKDQADKLRKRAGAAAKESRKRSKEGIDAVDLETLTRKGKTTASELSSEVAAGAAALATVANRRSRSAVDAVKKQTPPVRDRAQEAVSDARKYGQHVMEQATDRLPELRDAVTSTLDAGKELVSEARQSADRELVPALKGKAETTAKALGDVTSQASEKWSGVSGTAEERSRDVAHAAAQGSRDTGATLAWTAVAGGLIYYAFMDEEQRAKLKASGARIVQEAREIYRDIQGEDETFTEA